MSSAELLLTTCVAIVVIPPSKWPMLAHHLSQALAFWHTLQKKGLAFWQQQLAHYALAEREAKARAAEEAHRKNT